MLKKNVIALTSAASIVLGLAGAAEAAVSLRPIGTYASGLFDEGAAEIAAYDPLNAWLYVTNAEANSIDILDIGDPETPTLLDSISVGGGINSVAFNTFTNGAGQEIGYIAAAVEADPKQDNGSVEIYQTSGLPSGVLFQFKTALEVGALPDMLTFTPDGQTLLVANEGEPSEDYSVDPEGSVSIIDVSEGPDGVDQGDVTTADFTAFNAGGSKADQLDDNVRIFGLNASVAQDLEPEFIAVSEDSTKAYVALQENNALAVLDLLSGEFTEIVGLGFKDHSLPGNGLDASNRDDAINIQNWPVFGMYQPDAIATYTVDGETYVVTANEGDSRIRPTDDDALAPLEEGDIFNEEERIADVELDPGVFGDAAERQELQLDENLGRLKITNTLGDTDGDGDFDELYAYGARSFSIWNEAGELVWDSGDQFEQILAERLPADFNSTNDENDSFDNRSDDKGPEPEGVTIGVIGGKVYAFIGLERIGGVMVYDVTDPFNPTFSSYTNNRDFIGDAEAGTAGDLGPEGLAFIDMSESPNGKNLLVVTNEVSGTTTIYEAVSVPEPATLAGLLVMGAIATGGALKKKKTSA